MSNNADILDILNPGDTFTLWSKPKAVHLKIVSGPGKILRDHALLFADDLAARNCVVGEELQDINEDDESEDGPSLVDDEKKEFAGKRAGRPKKESKE